MSALVQLTENAAKAVQASLDDALPGGYCRISIRGGGCSGFNYEMDLVKDFLPQDQHSLQYGVKVIVDPISATYLKGTTIDYVRHGLQTGFTFNNPGAKHTCGCGKSFAI
jgi:iron-sulfur cluster assembly protein